MIADSRHPLPPEMMKRMQDFAGIWRDCSRRPAISRDVADRWEKLIQLWLDSDLPLFVQHGGRNRGCIFQHQSGRLLVPTDESPAAWAFELALYDRCPSLVEVKHLQREDRIPVARDLECGERRRAIYRCIGRSSLRQRGWKLHHLQQIGIDERAVLQTPVAEITRHFRLFMSPANMYVG